MKQSTDSRGNDYVQRRLTGILIQAVVFALAIGAASQGAWAQAERVLQPGQVIALRMTTALNSKTSRAGDRFAATTFEPVVVDGVTVIPVGTTVEGRVTAVEPAKRLSRSGTIAVEFDRVVFKDGRSVPIVGQLTSLDPEERRRVDEEGEVEGASTTKRNVIFIGGGAGVGAVIGAVTGSAGAGAGIGAGLGTAAVLLSKGNEATIEPGYEFGLELLKAARIPSTAAATFGTREDLLYAQAYLRDMGYYAGAVDGRQSSTLRAAIVRLQRAENLGDSGALDGETARIILLSDASGVRTVPVEVTSVESAVGPNGNVEVTVVAQTNTGGWDVAERHFVNRDTVHVYVRGIPPDGPATQALERHELKFTLAAEDAGSVTRYVVHGVGADVTGELGGAAGGVDLAALSGRVVAMQTAYERALGVRVMRTGAVTLTGRNYTDGEMELYFAVNALASQMRLYAAIEPSLRDPAALKGSLQLIVRAARQVDRAIGRAATARTTGAERDWAAMRPDFDELARAAGASLEREETR
jgi:peptidoglycan hydrolase-like protein with peptidoglycan-binding domain